MIEMSRIKTVSDRIAREFQPERIILFGSYAYGRPSDDSDVDMLVIMPFKGKGFRKSLEILNRVEPDFPVDLLVRSSEQVKKRVTQNDFFLRDVLLRGKVLYEATHG